MKHTYKYLSRSIMIRSDLVLLECVRHVSRQAVRYTTHDHNTNVSYIYKDTSTQKYTSCKTSEISLHISQRRQTQSNDRNNLNFRNAVHIYPSYIEITRAHSVITVEDFSAEVDADGRRGKFTNKQQRWQGICSTLQCQLSKHAQSVVRR
jgi:hypothetical protein